MKRLAPALFGIIFLLTPVRGLAADIADGSQVRSGETYVAGPDQSAPNKKPADSASATEASNADTTRKNGLESYKDDKSSPALSYGGSFRVRSGWTGNK